MILPALGVVVLVRGSGAPAFRGAGGEVSETLHSSRGQLRGQVVL